MNAPHKTPGQKAIQRHRERLSQAGMARFEVKAPMGDKDLIRRLAQALAQSDKADVIRRDIEAVINPAPPRTKGRIFAALQSAPFGDDVTFERIAIEPRKIDL